MPCARGVGAADGVEVVAVDLHRRQLLRRRASWRLQRAAPRGRRLAAPTLRAHSTARRRRRPSSARSGAMTNRCKATWEPRRENVRIADRTRSGAARLADHGRPRRPRIRRRGAVVREGRGGASAASSARPQQAAPPCAASSQPGGAEIRPTKAASDGAAAAVVGVAGLRELGAVDDHASASPGAW